MAPQAALKTAQAAFPFLQSYWPLPAALAQARPRWPQNWQGPSAESTSILTTTTATLLTCRKPNAPSKTLTTPALIESPLLVVHMRILAAGGPIERPLYDFSTHTRIPGKTETFRPGPFLLVEGIFALYYTELFPLYHLRVYVDTPDELCFEHRLKRDIEERGRSPESIRRQYEATVRPSSVAFVRPSAEHADLIVDGTGALDWKVERVLYEMRNRGLLSGAPKRSQVTQA